MGFLSKKDVRNNGGTKKRPSGRRGGEKSVKKIYLFGYHVNIIAQIFDPGKGIWFVGCRQVGRGVFWGLILLVHNYCLC